MHLAPWRHPVIWLSLALLTASAEPIGWRYDGTARFPDADPPMSFGFHPPTLNKNVCWKTEFEEWGNASLVPIGDLLCTTAEPYTLMCLNKADGTVAWTSTNSYTDILSPAERAKVEQQMSDLESQRATLRELQREYSLVRRQLKTGGADAAAKMKALTQEMNQLRQAIEAASGFEVPTESTLIGYASATPLVSGSGIYSVFGNGVVAKHDAKGDRKWASWLGKVDHGMRGYDLGFTASPVMAGDTLIVAYDKLRGLDPETGAVKWVGQEYADYGTPAVVEFESPQGKKWVIFTPAGEAIDAQSGARLGSGYGNIYYTGPVADGNTVYWFGGINSGHREEAGSASITAWTFDWTSDGLQATSKWRSQVPTLSAWFNSPVVHDDHLFAVSGKGKLWVLNAANGQIEDSVDLSAYLEHDVYPSPAIAGDHLFLSDISGSVVILDTEKPFGIRSQAQVVASRSNPHFDGKQVFYRALNEVLCFTDP